ncbi:hypothetical protein LA080_011041 [Diaporthe eres]|nr:hypothetical protein LA080_011041 [Diaporthe eres]
MLLCTSKDKALQSIRLAMSRLAQANKGLLAQRLINKLKRSICDISARRLYPSWYNHLDPDQVMNRETSGKDTLRTAVRHLWDACLDFEAAGIRGAAYVCLEFSTQIVIDELLTVQSRTSGTVESP